MKLLKRITAVMSALLIAVNISVVNISAVSVAPVVAEEFAEVLIALELSLALERLSAFNEFSNSALAILRLSVPEPMTYVSIDTNYARSRIDRERNKGK